MTKAPRRRAGTVVAAGNLLAAIPATLKEEQFSELVASEHVRIERIVSRGQASAPDQWYDEDEAEWVMVVAGAARLVFDADETGAGETRDLGPGDHVYIPPHRRHRVDWTDPGQATVWLAVHFR